MSFFEGDSVVSILVVDDEDSIRDVLDEFLSLKGFAVTTAADGMEALSILESDFFDIILMDIKMPVMDGIQVLKEIKHRGVDSIVIMMTAFGTVETATEAFRLGAHDYLLKPFNSEMIFNTIQNAVKQRSLQLENVYLKATVNLFDVAQAVEESIETDVFVTQLGDSLLKESSADIVSIYLQDRDSGEIQNRKNVFAERRYDAGDVDTKRLVEILVENEEILTSGSSCGIFFKNPLVDQIHSFMAVPIKRGRRILGFFLFYSFRKGNVFRVGQMRFMRVFASYFSASLENNRLYGDLMETFNQTMQGFAHALEAKDKYTQGHSERVTMYAVALAREINLAEEDVDIVYRAGRLHDIGKIGLQYEKLNKPGKLTDEEFEMFKKHPVIGKKILRPIRFLSNVIPLVYHHHERYDGRGYPEGLKAEEIPLGARVLAIADTYDAMTSDRSYRKALSHDIAMEEILRCSGAQFDPELVGPFEVAIGKYRQKCAQLGLDYPL